MKSTKLAAILVTGLTLFASACGSTDETANGDLPEVSEIETTEADTSQAATDDTVAPASDATASSEDEFPEITGVEASGASDGTWTIEVTVSSAYDSPEQYADAWRVLDQDGNELGILELSHDHASEQPFTRSLEGVEIPEGVKKITVEGRDSVNGWGGQTFLYSLPGPSSY